MIRLKKIFLEALPIIQKIEKAGYEAYFVGGCVRDYLLGRPIHDVDIATSATPEEVKKIFPSTVDVGIEHGTILVLYNGNGYEITTFRSESNYVDYRRPETVTFIRSLEEDLKRRDFTMNAIAMNSKGELIDPFCGQQAIENKIIETVGDPGERFQEDALRLMRAVCFVSQLNFHLEEKTKEAIINYAPLLKHIAIERITQEMQKLFAGCNKKFALKLTVETNLFQYLPAIFNEEKTLQTMLELPLDDLHEIDMWVLGIYLQNDKNPVTMLKKWKLPTQQIKFIIRAAQFLHYRVNKEWTDYQLYLAGRDIIEIVERIYYVLHNQKPEIAPLLQRYDQLCIHSRSELAVSGKDILAWLKKKPGPWMKNVLQHLEQAVIEKKVENNPTAIRSWLESWKVQSKLD